MKYSVAIRKNETGEVRIRTMEDNIQWKGDGDLWWWTEGNFGCDCNRIWEFQRAGGEKIDYDEGSNPCGDTRFTVLYAELENGTKIQIDNAPVDQ